MKRLLRYLLIAYAVLIAWPITRCKLCGKLVFAWNYTQHAGRHVWSAMYGTRTRLCSACGGRGFTVSAKGGFICWACDGSGELAGKEYR